MMKEKFLLDEIENEFDKLTREIVEIILKNPGISASEISEKIGKDVTLIRKILYALYKEGILDLEREELKRGWWKYKWKCDKKRIVFFLLKEKKKKLEELDSGKDYYCEKCKKSYTYEEALSLLFKCPCGGFLKEKRQEEKESIAQLEKEIKRLEEFFEKLS